MTFAGINYLAVIIAAVAAWLAGAVWYMALGKPWMRALGRTPEQMDELKGKPKSIVPFILAFVGALGIAWVLAGLLGHLGPAFMTVRNGALSGLFCWLGFVFTTMLVNNSFATRKPMLLLIDGGHWALVMALIGAIIGGMGT
jgi:hypothetical protein